jgi:hypothetical protein
MIVLLLGLLTNSQLEYLSDRFPVVVNLLDSPDFEVREAATDFLIYLGKAHLENPKDQRAHYVYYYVNKALNDGLKGGSLEKKNRIDRIIQEIRPPKDPDRENTMIDTLRRMYGGSKVCGGAIND